MTEDRTADPGPSSPHHSPQEPAIREGRPPIDLRRPRPENGRGDDEGRGRVIGLDRHTMTSTQAQDLLQSMMVPYSNPALVSPATLGNGCRHRPRTLNAFIGRFATLTSHRRVRTGVRGRRRRQSNRVRTRGRSPSASAEASPATNARPAMPCPPDELHQTRPECCEDCSNPLAGVDSDAHRHQLIDIPQARVCPRRTWRPARPSQSSPVVGSVFGGRGSRRPGQARGSCGRWHRLDRSRRPS